MLQGLPVAVAAALLGVIPITSMGRAASVGIAELNYNPIGGSDLEFIEWALLSARTEFPPPSGHHPNPRCSRSHGPKCLPFAPQRLCYTPVHRH